MSELPEFFLITLKFNPEELNRIMTVVFQYKGSNSKNFKKKIIKIRPKKTKHKVKFIFSKSEFQSNGRIELWNVQIKRQSTILAEKSCCGLKKKLSNLMIF